MDPSPAPTCTGPTAGIGPKSFLIWSFWFGAVAGTVELAAFLLKCHAFGPRNYNASRHFVWMHPVAGLVVVGGPGVALALAAGAWPRRVGPPLVLGVLTFLAALGVLFRLPLFTAAGLALAAGLAVRTARTLGARPAGFDRLARRSAPLLALALAATVAASYGRGLWAEVRAAARRPGMATKATATAGAGPRNVLLLVLDTVRSDRLGLGAGPRARAPHLARLAARGVRFDHALSTAPWTAPAHAGMFTGRWCHELSVGWDRPLDRTWPTLAEFLAARGYATAGFVANTTYCSYETGLDRGFAHYEDYDVTPRAVLLCSALVQRTWNFVGKRPALARLLARGGLNASGRKSAARINRDFLRWLDRAGDRPFFAFLNYYDAHHPYLTPGHPPASVADEAILRDWWGLDKRRLSPRDRAMVRAAYDRCLAYLDRAIGRLIAELERRGRLDDTLVIVTADHGEHLGEQGLYGHGASLYRPEIHVPLLLVAPGSVAPGRVVGRPVSLRDLPATVVDRLGLAAGGAPFPGRSLARAWSADPEGAGDLVRSEIQAPPEDDPNGGGSPARRGPMLSLVGAGYHYIRNGDGREELYRLDDPAEARDLAALPGSAAALRRFRARAGTGDRPSPPGPPALTSAR